MPDIADPAGLTEAAQSLLLGLSPQGRPDAPEVAWATAYATLAIALRLQAQAAPPVINLHHLPLEEMAPGPNPAAELEALRGLVRKLKGSGRIVVTSGAEDGRRLGVKGSGIYVASGLTAEELNAWVTL